MQVNVVDMSSVGVAGYDYMLYPEHNQGTMQYLSNQFNNFNNNLSEIGRQFMDKTKEVYHNFTNSNVARAAIAALQTAKVLLHPNTIIPLNTLEEIRSAQPIMQRYIMAEPTIREAYHDNRCDGFYGTYSDNEPGWVRGKQYDFRRVMDGIIEDTEEGWSVTTYAEDLREGDTRELSLQEKAYVLSTWESVKLSMEHSDEDFTHPSGGKLGI